ncbi:MAG: NUDIX hydrolase [Verrucomicrobiota bacterium]
MNAISEIAWTGQHLRIRRNGRWEYAERTKATGAAVIVALTDDRKLVLIEQFRIPVQARVIELPAGLCGDVEGEEKEALAMAARRELFEETGFEAAHFQMLTSGPPSAGMSSEIVTFFLAEKLSRKHSGGGEGHEEIVVHEVSLGQVEHWLAEKEKQGLLVDPKVYCGLYFVLTRMP